MVPLLKLVALVIALLGPLGYVLLGDDLDRHARQQEHLHRIERQNRQIEADNADLRHRIQALRVDPRFLEKAAREELGWIRDGETIYRVPGATPRPTGSQ